MSEYKKYFEAYCKEHDLELRLSSEMPVGYETANGTFDVLNCTPFVRQYGILFRKWGVFVCQREYHRKNIVGNSK